MFPIPVSPTLGSYHPLAEILHQWRLLSLFHNSQSFFIINIPQKKLQRGFKRSAADYFAMFIVQISIINEFHCVLSCIRIFLYRRTPTTEYMKSDF